MWDVSSAAYKDTHSKGQISTDIPFRPNLSIIPALSVSSPATGTRQKWQLFMSATALHQPFYKFSVCCDLTQV